LLDDTVATAADRVVLKFHDGASSQCLLGLQVTGECRDGWHEHPDVEGLSFLKGTNDPVHNGGTDLVLNRTLLVIGSGDEELTYLA
jgi:hypothetical protein